MPIISHHGSFPMYFISFWESLVVWCGRLCQYGMCDGWQGNPYMRNHLWILLPYFSVSMTIYEYYCHTFLFLYERHPWILPCFLFLPFLVTAPLFCFSIRIIHELNDILFFRFHCLYILLMFSVFSMKTIHDSFDICISILFDISHDKYPWIYTWYLSILVHRCTV